MSTASITADELRVLVLAPFGRDGPLTCEVLKDANIDSACCRDVADLCDQLRHGAGAIVVAAEALRPSSVPALAAALAEQPPWSDLPLVLATASGEARAAREWTLRVLQPARHVTLLERPVRLPTLVSVVRSALGTRRRQYEMRDLLEELRLTVERLDAEHVVRERFVDLLAHDLRGPLGVSKLTAQGLHLRPDDPALVRTLATRIDKNVNRADRMIRNLLDAHRLRAGQSLPVELRRCDLVSIVHDAIDDLSGDDRTRVRVTAPDHIEGRWDADLLWRAIWNLVTNALKYGDAAAPIEVHVACVQETVRTSVHNHGPAIPAEARHMLFEPFSRARTTSMKAARGWGLGLTLVRGVAAAHGGTLELTSDDASGTTFTLQMPLDARPHQRPQQRPHQRPHQRG